MAMKSLLKNYQHLSRDEKPAPTILVNTTPHYSVFEKIWNENKTNMKNQLPENMTSKSPIPFQTIGLLFIIIDDLPHELIWRTWLHMTSKDHISPVVQIFIHAKYPDKIRSPWVKSHLVNFHYSPEWGSIEITKVMIGLLREAITMNASSNIITHLCFVSESCIPAVSLDEAIEMIQTNNTSWIKFKNQANNGFASQNQFIPLSRAIPIDCVFKADQWVLLLRHHAEELLTLIDSLPFDPFEPFHSVRASDEMFIPTYLSLLNYVSKISQSSSSSSSTSQNNKSIEIISQFDSSQFSSRRMTYCLWEISNPKNPTTFPHISSSITDGTDLNSSSYNLYNNAKEEGCLFMRKLMNSNIKYPFESERRGKRRTQEHSSSSRLGVGVGVAVADSDLVVTNLENLWRYREEILREWCEPVLKLSLDLEDSEVISINHSQQEQIWRIIHLVKEECQNYSLQIISSSIHNEERQIDMNDQLNERQRNGNYQSRSRDNLNRNSYRSRSRSRSRERNRGGRTRYR